MEQVNIQVIARMHSDFASKFGIPRQSGLVEELRSTIVFEPEFRNADALRGIEDFSHLWLIWQFSEAVRTGWSPTALYALVLVYFSYLLYSFADVHKNAYSAPC